MSQALHYSLTPYHHIIESDWQVDMFGSRLLRCTVSPLFEGQRVPVLSFSLYRSSGRTQVFVGFRFKCHYSRLKNRGHSSSFRLRIRIYHSSPFCTCGAFCLFWVLIPSLHGCASHDCWFINFQTYLMEITGASGMPRNCRPFSISVR